MECYSCHATWAPQCYGCHVKIDYSKLSKRRDWVAIAGNPNKNGLTAEAFSDKEEEAIKKYVLSGEVKENRSFLRWEDPPLVVNGEHRISPAIPGCQTTVTVIGRDGKAKMLNHIFRIPNVEGAGDEGQLGIDIAPLHPHTVQKEARSCESCHNNPKAMGYGIESGKLYSQPDSNIVMDLTDIDGNPIPNQIDTQFNAIPNLSMDWSRFLDEDGKQLQTVGHHFSGSRPLNKEELDKLDRRGVCLSCHKDVPKNDIASDLLSHVAKYAGMKIDNKTHSGLLNKSIKISAWAQVLLGIFLFIIPVYFGLRWFRKRKVIY